MPVLSFANWRQTQNLSSPLPCTVRRVALAGDSIANQHVSPAGSDGDANLEARGVLWNIQQRLNYPFDMPVKVTGSGSEDEVGFEFGISGATIAESFNQTFAAIKSYSPDSVFLIAGTNDVDTGRTLAQMQADFTSWHMAVRDQIGCMLFAMVVLPRNEVDDFSGGSNQYWDNKPGSTGSAADKALLANVYNDWMVAYAAMHHDVRVIDPRKYITDVTTGDLLPSFSIDGVHPSSLFGYWAGVAGAEAIGDVAIGSDAGLYSPTEYHATLNPYGNMVESASLVGVGGAAGRDTRGEIADDWRVEVLRGTGVSVVCSKRIDAFGHHVQRVVVSSGATAGLEKETIRLRKQHHVSMKKGVVSGKFYEASVRMKWSNVTANGFFKGAYIKLWNTTTGAHVLIPHADPAGYMPAGEELEAWLKAQCLQAGADGDTYRLEMYVDVDASVLNASVAVDFWLPMCRRMPIQPVF